MNAVVIGTHEIPQKTAMHIRVSVYRATVGYNTFPEGPCEIKSRGFESTLNTVLEGSKTVAVLGNSTTTLDKHKQGALLGHALVFDG